MVLEGGRLCGLVSQGPPDTARLLFCLSLQPRAGTFFGCSGKPPHHKIGNRINTFSEWVSRFVGYLCWFVPCRSLGSGGLYTQLDQG